jgi:hypothetical protein
LSRQSKVIYEPPLTELLVALGYVMGGGERPWLGYLLATAFWLRGGRFVYDIAYQLTGDTYGGVLALAYYLLIPLGIILSRSFQPEAAMVFGLCVGLWWLVVRLQDGANWRQTALAGLVCGLAMLLKPGFAFFPLLATYFVMRWQKLGPRRAVWEPHWLLFVGLLVLPSVIYAYFFLGSHAGEKFLPQLWFQANYYRGLWMQTNAAVGWYALAAAIVGACLLVKQHGSYVGLALLLAYGLFCAMFTYHSITHSYYHAIAIVIVAVCMAPLATPVREACRGLARWQTALCLLVAIVSMVHFSAGAAPLIQRHPEFAQQIRFYKQLGDLCGRGSVVLCLDQHYGTTLRYHSWLVTAAWPTTADLAYQKLRGTPIEPAGQRLDKMIEQQSPEYFIVTNLAELSRQPELAALLNRRYRKRAEGPSAVVFDLRQTPPSPRGAAP